MCCSLESDVVKLDSDKPLSHKVCGPCGGDESEHITMIE